MPISWPNRPHLLTYDLGRWTLVLSVSLYLSAPLAEPQSRSKDSPSLTPEKQSHPPHAQHFPNPLWQLSIWIIVHVENWGNFEVLSPLLSGPQGTEEVGAALIISPPLYPGPRDANGSWTGDCKDVWRLAIGFLRLSWVLGTGWSEPLHSKAAVCDCSLTLPFSSSLGLAPYWGTLLFIKPLLSLHELVLNLGCTLQSSEEL